MGNKSQGEEGKRKGESSGELGLADMIKKVTALGLGAAFMTEDAIKSALNTTTIPQSILNSILEQAKNQKNTLLPFIRDEVAKRLSKINLSKEVDRVLKDYDINVNATFSFRKKTTDKKDIPS